MFVLVKKISNFAYITCILSIAFYPPMRVSAMELELIILETD